MEVKLEKTFPIAAPAAHAWRLLQDIKAVAECMPADERKMEMDGKGTDVTGASAATMNLTARVQESSEGHCELVGVSNVTVTGKLANFGGRMMTQVSDQILKQFGDNFATRVIAQGEGADAEQAAAAVAKQPKELNALALIWHALLGFFKSLFGGGKA
ncbi:MAG: carbon monoxide dehydrogenase [Gammaproteobacteria bacterium]